MKKLLFSSMFIALAVLLWACHSAEVKTPESLSDTIDVSNCQEDTVRYTAMEQQLIDFGLVDIAEVDSTIGVEIVYATPDNFLGHVLYPDIHHAFAIPAMAQKLVKAQRFVCGESGKG